VNFSRFQAAIHILRLNCAETIQDRPGQPAYIMFGIKRWFQRCKVLPPRFKESSVRMHQMRVPPSKRAVSATVVQSSKITVADRHRLVAAHHNKHCWRAFRGYQHRWPWMTLNSKNMGFKWIFRYFRLWRTHTVNFRWNILEIDQDHLRTKLNWCCRVSHEH